MIVHTSSISRTCIIMIHHTLATTFFFFLMTFFVGGGVFSLASLSLLSLSLLTSPLASLSLSSLSSSSSSSATTRFVLAAFFFTIFFFFFTTPGFFFFPPPPPPPSSSSSLSNDTSDGTWTPGGKLFALLPPLPCIFLFCSTSFSMCFSAHDSSCSSFNFFWRFRSSIFKRSDSGMDDAIFSFTCCSRSATLSSCCWIFALSFAMSSVACFRQSLSACCPACRSTNVK
mmetsp:Transcript_4613/g.13302  ORF Transcript_4613/g.13302 Transcript_4613/m.13302 type:complete len:228 (-) Transcript_4613:518-1201(-)